MSAATNLCSGSQNQKRRKWRLLKVSFQVRRPELLKGLKRVSVAQARKKIEDEVKLLFETGQKIRVHVEKDQS